MISLSFRPLYNSSYSRLGKKEKENISAKIYIHAYPFMKKIYIPRDVE